MNTANPPVFGKLLRQWREARHYSQLDLALEADVSAKHVSFLETGRNRPSRDMVLRLSNAMDVPLRDRNALFEAAGFSAAYRESSLDAPEIAQVEKAVTRILAKHEPYPAIVLDADWNILRQNRGGAALSNLLFDEPELVTRNAFELLFSPEGLQPLVVNWAELASVLLMRLCREAMAANASEAKRDLFRRIEALPTTPREWREIANGLPSGPTIDLQVEKGGVALDFFTTVTTIGTPQDITLQELRVESYFPADDETERLCAGWVTAPGQQASRAGSSGITSRV